MQNDWKKRNEAAGVILGGKTLAADLEVHATIVPKRAMQGDLVLGSDDCPTCYRVTSVRNAGNKVFAECTRAHFERLGERTKTFIFDPDTELSIIPAEAYLSLREKWANKQGLS